MSSIYKEIFTESTKDVIGNDPVLDQFDISYAASLYKSSEDDYITGSILSINTSEKGFTSLTEGTRGRVFSKFYETSYPTLVSYEQILKSPWISWYLIPWKDRFARTSRYLQCFDANERYYDSCLPDLKNALSVDGTEVWGIDPNSGNFHSVLSPISNYVTSSSGYVVFNSVKQDRTSEGFEIDPLVNNMWTWSYPFENKYQPNRRYLKFTDTLGIDGTYLYCNWGMSSNTYEWNLKFDNIRRYEPENLYSLKNIYPILPGRFKGNADSGLNPSYEIGYRNALRGSFNNDASYKVKIPNLFDAGLDSLVGLSFLLPTDSNIINSLNYDPSHLNPEKVEEYDDVVPDEQLLFQSLKLDDSVKFYFGFGDLNNMTYASASIEEKTDGSYTEDFEKSKDILFYFWSGEGSGLFGGSVPSYSGADAERALTIEPEDEYPDSAQELSLTLDGTEPYSWIQFAPPASEEGISPCSYWQTKKFTPLGSSYTIPGNDDDSWTIILNMKANVVGIQVKARVYIVDSSGFDIWSGTYLATETISTSWRYLIIPVPGTDLAGVVVTPDSRIVVDIQVSNPEAACVITFSTRIDYAPGEEADPEPVYSTLLSRIPVDSLSIVPSYDIETYESTDLRVDWTNSTKGGNEWFELGKDGDQDLNGDPCSYIGIGSSSPSGIYWINPNNLDNYVLHRKVLFSEYEPIAHPASVDITSSVAWSIKYDRGSLGSDMHVYFSGIPGTPAENDTSVLYEIETCAASTESYALLTEFNSINLAGGNQNNPWVFGPGEYKLCFATAPVGGTEAAINNLQITTYNVSFDPFGPKVGGNNYPEFRKYLVLEVENMDKYYDDFTPVERLATKQFYQSHIISVSPVIRGWKYGLVNGFPTNTKTIFRRDRYGQFRDMLEQRQYTKLVTVNDSPVDDNAIVKDEFSDQASSRLSRTITMTQVNDAPVQVGFFRQRYKKDERGIGYIYKERVSPDLTYSQNMSSEVTSSLPYFDGEAKMRQESSLGLIKDTMITSLQFDPSGFTVI